MALPQYTYYYEIAQFLRNLELHTGLSVIIALHQTNNSIEFEQVFHGFQKLQRKTKDLVKKANFVVGHYSTALSFAVLLNKPILLIQFPEKYKYLYKSVKRVSKLLKINPIKLPKRIDDISFIFHKINHKDRQEYIKKMVVSDGDMNFSNKERMSNIISKLTIDE